MSGRIALLWLVGLNVRLSLLALPPVLPLVRHDLGLSEAGVAALAGLPLLLFGLAAVPGALVIVRVGAVRALIGGLLFIGVCAGLRGVGPSVGMLFGATLGLGIAIAVVQPAIPTLVQQWYPGRVARVTSVYSNGLLMGTVLSASLSLPLVLPLVGGSWEWDLVVWGVPAVLAAVLLRANVRSHQPPVQCGRRAWLPDWRSPRLWQLGLLQSAGTLGFFGASTFIPDYLHATNQPELVAPALASLSLGQLPGALLVGLLPWSRVARRGTALWLGSTLLAALGALQVAPAPLFLAAAALLGTCCGATLVLALALPPLSAAPGDVPRVAAGVLAIGYSVVWLGLLVAGAAWDATHLAATAFLPAALSAAIVLLLGPRLLNAPRGAISAIHPVQLGVHHDHAA